MTNREKVAAIRQAWRELTPEEPPIAYGSGPAIDLDLYAQVAINVLTDWHKRPVSPQAPEMSPADHLRRASAELATGDDRAARTHALMAIAAAVVAETQPIDTEAVRVESFDDAATDILAEHRFATHQSSFGDKCVCGWTSHEIPHAAHQWAHLVNDLGLHEECG